MHKNTDLRIRVVSNLCTTQQVLLYQQDIQSNLKNFLTAAWEHPHIAPKAQYVATLPMGISVSAAPDIDSGRMSTKELQAENNTALEAYSNGCMAPYSEDAPEECVCTCPSVDVSMMAVNNVPPPPSGSLTVALPGQEDDAIKLDCTGQEYLTITLDERPDGSIQINHDFSEF